MQLQPSVGTRIPCSFFFFFFHKIVVLLFFFLGISVYPEVRKDDFRKFQKVVIFIKKMRFSLTYTHTKCLSA